MGHLVNGVNLGGWLSHYTAPDPERFNFFITESDIQRIAGWGFDHVRLPVDYRILESDDAVGVPVEEGYSHVDNCVRWCEAAGLAIVLDLHSGPGYAFQYALEDDGNRYNTLLDNRALQRRFLELWCTIVERYKDAPVDMYFDLLNEVIVPDVGPWNRLLVRTVDSMRAIAPECKVIIGGMSQYYGADLQELALVGDENALFTFHFYEPLLFTHQGAPWMAEVREWGGAPTYPGGFDGLAEFLDRAPEYRERYGALVGATADRAMIAQRLEPALKFARDTGRTLYCGEFGVVQWADPASRRAWVRDVLAELNAAGIGHALWNYKTLSFSLVDRDGSVLDQEFLDIVCGKA